MEKVCIREVRTRRDMRRFVLFPEKLYRGCVNWVPALLDDEYRTLDRRRNPAFEFCEAVYYLALDEREKVVGRIAGIINHRANADWKEKTVRFGWLDFIEDGAVLRALTDAVADWGRSKGMDKIKGPLGFSDMDKEGLLVEGFENLSSFTCLYNYPYYDPMLKALGFEKDADWTQKIVTLSPTLPPMFQYASLVEERFGLHLMGRKSRKELLRKGEALFHVLNDAFAPLYEFTPLSDAQIKDYVRQYIPLLNQDLFCMVEDAEGRTVGFCICVPSLSKAIQKARGRYLPFGFVHLLRALHHNDSLEALIIGVLPEYQGKGANVLIFKHIHENCIKWGINKMILNPQLETNFKVQSLFGDYETRPYTRRRSYVKSLQADASAPPQRTASGNAQ